MNFPRFPRNEDTAVESLNFYQKPHSSNLKILYEGGLSRISAQPYSLENESKDRLSSLAASTLKNETRIALGCSGSFLAITRTLR